MLLVATDNAAHDGHIVVGEVSVAFFIKQTRNIGVRIIVK